MASGLIAMATNFLSLGTKEGMEKLDKLLGQQNFISGATPCKDDLVVYGALKGSIDINHVNILRWYNQVNDIIGPQFSREGEGIFIKKIITPSVEQNIEETSIVNVAHPSALNEVIKDDLNVLHEEIDEENIFISGSLDILKKPVLKDFEMRTSLIKLQIKPWNIEDNLVEVEKHVRGVKIDGLIWGDSQFVVLEDDRKVLEIMMTIEGDKVSPLDLIDKILGNETTDNHIQSCDIVSFNKLLKKP